MSKKIQVGDLPEQLYRTLESRAAGEGMTLSDYIKRELEQSAARPSFAELDARVSARPRSGIETREIVAAIRECRDA